MDSPTRLSNWPWVEVRVDCRMCTRRGCYRLARLAHRFGAEMDLENLLAALASDCPHWRSSPRKYEMRCGVRYTDWDHRKPTLDVPLERKGRQPSEGMRVLTLADLPGPTVAIVCPPCRRRGVLAVARLIERFGTELPLPTVLGQISADCPARRESTPRCHAVYENPLGRRLEAPR